MARKASGSSAANTRTLILDAAERLFETRGVEGTSLQLIGEAVGIRAPSLLHHFASKEALLVEVIERLVSRARDVAMEGLLSTDSPAERFHSVVEATRQLWRANPHLVSITVSELLRPDGVARAPIEAVLIPALEKVERSFRGAAGLPADAPVRGILLTFVAATVLRLCMGELGARLWGGDDDPDELLALLLAGLERHGRRGGSRRG